MAKRGRNKFEVKKSTGLIITSLIDFFSIVVIYLMKSYSSEGSILTNSDNLVLPNSISTTKPKDINVQIAATSDMVLLDNNPIVPTEDVRKISQDNPNPVIPQLEQTLAQAVSKAPELTKAVAELEQREISLRAASNIRHEKCYVHHAVAVKVEVP